MVKPWAFLIFLLANGGDGAWVSTPPRQNYGYSSYKNNYQSTSLNINSITSQLKDLNWKVSKYKEQLYKAEDEIDSLWVSEVGQDYKIQSLEGKDKQHDGRLYSLEVNNERQDNEIDSLESKTAVNSGLISDIQMNCCYPPTQCINYNVLNDVERNIGTAIDTNDKLCDTTDTAAASYGSSDTNVADYGWRGNMWYRFMGPAGDQMPTSAVLRGNCGTSAPGWLSTSHPTNLYETVSATYCFPYTDDSTPCGLETYGAVTKCNDGEDFYVYYLENVALKYGNVNLCHMAYCGFDTTI